LAPIHPLLWLPSPVLHGHIRELGSVVAAVTEPSNFDLDGRKPISEYLWLRTIPNDETENQHLVCRAKGYLIHDDELCHHSTLGILQRCVPIEEGKELLLDIHERICGHHASSRSMDEKALLTRFLLDNGYRRRSLDHEVLQGLPILCKTHPRVSPRAPNHPHHMAFCRVGPGPLGTLQESDQGLNPPACRGRQIH
jgi:hypothetical protein